MFAFDLLTEFFWLEVKDISVFRQHCVSVWIKISTDSLSFWKETANNKAHLDIATCLNVL